MGRLELILEPWASLYHDSAETRGLIDAPDLDDKMETHEAALLTIARIAAIQEALGDMRHG